MIHTVTLVEQEKCSTSDELIFQSNSKKAAIVNIWTLYIANSILGVNSMLP